MSSELIRIQSLVYTIRNQRVMLDQDLAAIYGVETRVVNQQVKRNINKFPADFMFQLTKNEYDNLKSQNVTASWGGRRTLPYAFTERGAVQLASVIRSERADKISVTVVRVFTELRNILAENVSLKKRIEKLEKDAAKKDKVIKTFYYVLNELK
jgi:hypothetical protein